MTTSSTDSSQAEIGQGNENAEATSTSDILQHNGIAMRLDYAEPSQIISERGVSEPVISEPDVSESTKTLNDQQAEQYIDHVALFGQLNRPEVAFHAHVTQPLLFRDCLMALFDIVSADYRYVPKDRSAYTAFMQMRRASANQNLFASQRAYFDWLYNNDPLAYCILDPIVQVHEDGVTFEVFSKDEGSYASLTFTHALFDRIGNRGDTQFGTTYIDYSPALLQGIEQIRSYRETCLDIGQQAVALHTPKPDVNPDTTADKPVIEKRINVPKSWIRSLLQVQSATQLSQDRFELDPVSLYNLLFEMRMHADIKGKKRGLMIELVPQKSPVLTLEPFGIVVHSQSTTYQGKSAKLLRLWGRRRLALLKRVLPYTDKVTVTLLGQGMPSYWTLTGQGFHLTFAMTGFSQANWSQSLNFDLLLPKRPTAAIDSDADTQKIAAALQTAQDIPTLAKYLDKKPAEVRQSLLTLAQQGLVRFDLASQCFIYRPLTDMPLNMDDFAYHNLAEKQAYELVNRPKAITNFTVENLPSINGSGGVAIAADVEVKEDRRTYHSQLQLNDEGMVTRAECSCPQFLQHRLTQGVCSHLIAVRLTYAKYDRSKDENLRWQQSKLFSKRLVSKSLASQIATPMQNPDNGEAALSLSTDNQNVEAIEQIYLTLNQKKLIIERTGGKKNGRQQLLFNRPEQAYDAFIKHSAQFESAGYLENQVI